MSGSGEEERDALSLQPLPMAPAGTAVVGATAPSTGVPAAMPRSRTNHTARSNGDPGRAGTTERRAPSTALGDRVGPVAPGDLGRRVAVLRREHHLSREQLARAAGMAPRYLDYLEERPAEVNAATLLRLARALDTDVAGLLGARPATPPAEGTAGERPVLRPLGTDECHRLLAPGGVGRVVLSEPRGPVAIPVNFGVLDGDVVFRTSDGTPAAGVAGQEVGFEVDHLDAAARQGWSVLVTGTARRVVDPAEMAQACALVDPWAGGDREVCIRVTPTEVSGRRVQARP